MSRPMMQASVVTGPLLVINRTTYEGQVVPAHGPEAGSSRMGGVLKHVLVFR